MFINVFVIYCWFLFVFEKLLEFWWKLLKIFFLKMILWVSEVFDDLIILYFFILCFWIFVNFNLEYWIVFKFDFFGRFLLFEFEKL